MSLRARKVASMFAMSGPGIMSLSGTIVYTVGQPCFAVLRARFCGYLQ